MNIIRCSLKNRHHDHHRVAVLLLLVLLLFSSIIVDSSSSDPITTTTTTTTTAVALLNGLNEADDHNDNTMMQYTSLEAVAGDSDVRNSSSITSTTTYSVNHDTEQGHDLFRLYTTTTEQHQVVEDALHRDVTGFPKKEVDFFSTSTRRDSNSITFTDSMDNNLAKEDTTDSRGTPPTVGYPKKIEQPERQQAHQDQTSREKEDVDEQMMTHFKQKFAVRRRRLAPARQKELATHRNHALERIAALRKRAKARRKRISALLEARDRQKQISAARGGAPDTPLTMNQAIHPKLSTGRRRDRMLRRRARI